MSVRPQTYVDEPTPAESVMFSFASHQPPATAAAPAPSTGGGSGGGFSFGSIMSNTPSTSSRQPGDRDRIRRAILKVESGGDPNAVSPSGNHFGLYQMGTPRASDVGIPDARALLGNPDLAEWAFWESLKRSESIHRWVPDYVAVSWKAGTGSLRKVLAAEERGIDRDTAIAQLPWRTDEYVRRFRRAYEAAG